MDDRDNAAFADPMARYTMRVFCILTIVAPEPATAEELAEFTELPVETVTIILISLALDEWIRETAEGFQTIGPRLRTLDRIAYLILDESLVDGGRELPRRRYPNGVWEALLKSSMMILNEGEIPIFIEK
jgi:hypothetical protein